LSSSLFAIADGEGDRDGRIAGDLGEEAAIAEGSGPSTTRSTSTTQSGCKGATRSSPSSRRGGHLVPQDPPNTEKAREEIWANVKGPYDEFCGACHAWLSEQPKRSRWRWLQNWSTATGIRTRVSGLRIASAKPFAASSCLWRPGRSVQFRRVRWSRGHISGHGFGSQSSLRDYCTPGCPGEGGPRLLPFLPPCRLAGIEATDQPAQGLHALQHSVGCNEQQPIRREDHFVNRAHRSPPDRRHRKPAHYPIETSPPGDKPRRPVFFDPMRLRELIDSQSQSVERSPIGGESNPKLISVASLSLETSKTIGNDSRDS
jgi:hypothetical protein